MAGATGIAYISFMLQDIMKFLVKVGQSCRRALTFLFVSILASLPKKDCQDIEHGVSCQLSDPIKFVKTSFYKNITK